MSPPDLYARAPLCRRGTIPVFSETSDYICNYEKIATDHLEAQNKTGQNPWIEERFWLEMEQSTADMIRKYAKPGQRILDVGVGLGRVLSGFPELERYGVDISFDYLEEARKRGINVCYALVEELPYTAEYFDLVVCADVLEHVLDLTLACRNILAVLKKGGHLIIRVPYRENLAPYLLPSCPYKYVHLRNFDEHSLRLLLERIFGCEVLEISLTGHGASSVKFRDLLPASPTPGLFSKMAVAAKKILKVAGTLLKSISEDAYNTFRRGLYQPAEINVVARKADSKESERGG